MPHTNPHLVNLTVRRALAEELLIARDELNRNKQTSRDSSILQQRVGSIGIRYGMDQIKTARRIFARLRKIDMLSTNKVRYYCVLSFQTPAAKEWQHNFITSSARLFFDPVAYQLAADYYATKRAAVPLLGIFLLECDLRNERFGVIVSDTDPTFDLDPYTLSYHDNLPAIGIPNACYVTSMRRNELIPTD